MSSWKRWSSLVRPDSPGDELEPVHTCHPPPRPGGRQQVLEPDGHGGRSSGEEALCWAHQSVEISRLRWSDAWRGSVAPASTRPATSGSGTRERCSGRQDRRSRLSVSGWVIGEFSRLGSAQEAVPVPPRSPFTVVMPTAARGATGGAIGTQGEDHGTPASERGGERRPRAVPWVTGGARCRCARDAVAAGPQPRSRPEARLSRRSEARARCAVGLASSYSNFTATPVTCRRRPRMPDSIRPWGGVPTATSAWSPAGWQWATWRASSSAFPAGSSTTSARRGSGRWRSSW